MPPNDPDEGAGNGSNQNIVKWSGHSVNDLYRYQVREFGQLAMFTINPDGFFTSWNNGVEKLFGYREQEWLGKPARIIFSGPDNAADICNEELRKAREFGSVSDVRWHVRKDGSEFFANGFMCRLSDDDGKLIGYSKIMSDETVRKQLEDSLTESNTALEQFAYVASHDLQEPLRTMGAYAELLGRQYASQLDEGAERYIGYITNAAKRMGTLVQDLLEFARVQTEDRRPASIALDEDLESALSHLAHAIQESGGSVTHDPLPTLPADRGLMVRLFQNLIGNALKYRKPEEPPIIHISSELIDSEWLISVHDNGIGFDPEFAKSIFAPFKRLHTSGEYSGTGVGLAICRRIVERHHGRIWAESTPGVGSVFRFTLPAGTKT